MIIDRYCIVCWLNCCNFIYVIFICVYNLKLTKISLNTQIWYVILSMHTNYKYKSVKYVT